MSFNSRKFELISCQVDLVKIDLVKGSHSLFNRAFSPHDTILYRNEVAILEYNLCSMSLAVYAISIIKKTQVSIYIAVLTYAAVVFCPFNTYQKHYKYITPFVKIAI